ncbi:hypothetical protein HYALB_00000392 [Hymenoscyphus albidus]|uniref:Isomerase YbhE n=1 Tax=Hymenoscyphus albidus TaxID=595503 RepID=A0A9N9LG59_9HELO|nr:hypothetical protein HYALB_00000392 [Hymenoscyphus albidus]
MFSICYFLVVGCLLNVLPTAFAATSLLLASHFNGAIFTLSLETDTSGDNGKLSLVSASGGCGSTSTWLQYYSDTRALYCWDESWQDYGTMAEFNVSVDGILTVSGQARTTGNDVHGILYGGPKGRSFIASVQYSPSTLTTYALPLKPGPDAPFTVPLQLETFTIPQPGPDPRQDRPHPHQTILDPTGKFILVPDLGADTIRIFSINPTTGYLTSCPGAATAPGDGPRHGEYWRAKVDEKSREEEGWTLFTVNELGNSLSAWDVTYPLLDSNATCLSLSHKQTISTFTPGVTPPSTTYNGQLLPPKAAEVHTFSDSLYVANRNDKTFGPETDSLVAYKISERGELEFVAMGTSYSFYPRSFNVNKAGTLVAVGGQTSSSVAIVERMWDGRLGKLVARLEVGSLGTYTNEDGLSSVVWVE